MTEIQHAYPGYGMERAFLERAVREQHVDVIPELALGLLETTEIYAVQAQACTGVGEHVQGPRS